MNQTKDPIDQKGLMIEAYRIEGINDSQCRSIFLDWALSLPEGVAQRDAIETLIQRHADDAPDHPMSAVLKAGLTTMTSPKRRGGWRSRERN
ncbi:hypothetical protein DS909_16315 [Phaeobacter gallaeciensis]|uniref:Uncharacterized protein n=2 Tax=Roseobacteraceae TaxID=2854170 RepID=A0A366WS78_9RHOB|nr:MULTISPECIES: hypothetical protein [Roseobacteraceae]MBT3140852.1 hypothetical protein [Falsiruegeria litorea]MBT8170596.1 hypothetical protein [Falsiruegeria litorea]RBW52800.1 hypothetical protein DS909_16315 [Phaeobacter gallaeciensis]